MYSTISSVSRYGVKVKLLIMFSSGNLWSYCSSAAVTHFLLQIIAITICILIFPALWDAERLCSDNFGYRVVSRKPLSYTLKVVHLKACFTAALTRNNLWFTSTEQDIICLYDQKTFLNDAIFWISVIITYLEV